jgi:crotonobetainyl-CoA:carnitine CoA-transferase CaiB-like acyl-CoA transferase
VKARGAVVEIDHPRLGPLRELASPLRLSGTAPPLQRAPARGEHTEDVLADLCGYDAERIQRIARGGAFGEPA